MYGRGAIQIAGGNRMDITWLYKYVYVNACVCVYMCMYLCISVYCYCLYVSIDIFVCSLLGTYWKCYTNFYGPLLFLAALVPLSQLWSQVWAKGRNQYHVRSSEGSLGHYFANSILCHTFCFFCKCILFLAAPWASVQLRLIWFFHFSFFSFLSAC